MAHASSVPQAAQGSSLTVLVALAFAFFFGCSSCFLLLSCLPSLLVSSLGSSFSSSLSSVTLGVRPLPLPLPLPLPRPPLPRPRAAALPSSAPFAFSAFSAFCWSWSCRVTVAAGGGACRGLGTHVTHQAIVHEWLEDANWYSNDIVFNDKYLAEPFWRYVLNEHLENILLKHILWNKPL